MIKEDVKAHWEGVYQTRSPSEVSWFEDMPSVSLTLISRVAMRQSAIIDIGGSASLLAQTLLQQDFDDITVLDVSTTALDLAKANIGSSGARVNWIAADVRSWHPNRQYDIWHDRATFHFLTEIAAQRDYAATAKAAIGLGGFAIIGTFALDGPQQCSGLAIQRHNTTTVANIFRDCFELIEAKLHDHKTPDGAIQKFEFAVLKRVEM